ncbi:hypothetical protein Hanom_Chr04g00347911 [Helianthus anomalus]
MLVQKQSMLNAQTHIYSKKERKNKVIIITNITSDCKYWWCRQDQKQLGPLSIISTNSRK